MKKIVSLLVVSLLLVLVAAGCSSKSGAYKDGTYNAAQSQFDSHGWKGQIEITVKGGKITDVLYNEVDKNGKFKRDDADYASKMKAKNNITPKEVDEKLQQSLIDKQDPASVDTVTGATESSKTFKELAQEALKNAKQ